MRGARHPALSIRLLAVVLLAILASGCGSSGTGSSGKGATKIAAPQSADVLVCASAPGVGALRASGVDCATGREVAASWIVKNACEADPGASRASCEVGGYRCLGTATERGPAVSCARPGRSISFAVKRG